MQIELNAHEARVLGVLIEKATTTPDQYPLTLNASVNGCNQKSNRDPVVDFSEAEVTVAYQGLLMKQLAGSSFPAGSRVEKWHHCAREGLKLSDLELAILAELLMRGPQAPGALRARVARMARCDTLEQLQKGLDGMRERGLVKRVPPEYGSRAERYGQTLAPGLHPDGEAPVAQTPRSFAPAGGSGPHGQAGHTAHSAHSSPSAPPAPASGLGVRVAQLEDEVAALKRQLGKLAEQLGAEI